RSSSPPASPDLRSRPGRSGARPRTAPGRPSVRPARASRVRAHSYRGEGRQRDPLAFERITDPRIGEYGELDWPLARGGRRGDELGVGLAGVAHKLGDAVVEPREEREKIVQPDMPRMLELSGEVICRSHSLRTVLVALRGRVRACGRARVTRQLGDRP